MKHPNAIIRRIQLTEKSTGLSSDKNQYFFEVDPDANKHDIKRAVEDLYKVKVTGVNTMRYMGKARRERTPNYGRTAAWKRAIVTLKAGEQIDLT